jgi:hypothetical protein
MVMSFYLAWLKNHERDSLKNLGLVIDLSLILKTDYLMDGFVNLKDAYSKVVSESLVDEVSNSKVVSESLVDEGALDLVWSESIEAEHLFPEVWSEWPLVVQRPLSYPE